MGRDAGRQGEAAGGARGAWAGDLGQRHAAALEEVVEPARRGDDDVGAVAQVAELGSLRGAAVDAGAGDAAGAAELDRLLEDLVGELAGGSKHEDDGPVAGVDPAALGENVEVAREEEAEGLARARLGDADHVAALEGRGPRLGLDDGGGGEAGGADARHNLWGYRGLFEGEEGVCGGGRFGSRLCRGDAVGWTARDGQEARAEATRLWETMVGVEDFVEN